MVRVLVSILKGHGFDHKLGQTKDIRIGICNFTPKMQHLGLSVKTGQLRVRITCLNKVACLTADCCFHELAC